MLDRTELILEIFAQRAQTNEGKLQVELAQLEHLSTRLVRGWTHLERQRGGLGSTGGPGEKQIELDRRYIGNRVKILKEKLAQLQKQRSRAAPRARAAATCCRSRSSATPTPASRRCSTRLAHAKAYEADQLFATLDTTTRRVWIPGRRAMSSLSDTVGFIRDLPHGLVAAFRATLEETVHADLLLHVVDAASPARDEQVAEVNKVLAEIPARRRAAAAGLEQDRRRRRCEPGVERDQYGRISRVFVSARTGAGIGRTARRDRRVRPGKARRREARQHPTPSHCKLTQHCIPCP